MIRDATAARDHAPLDAPLADVTDRLGPFRAIYLLAARVWARRLGPIRPHVAPNLFAVRHA